MKARNSVPDQEDSNARAQGLTDRATPSSAHPDLHSHSRSIDLLPMAAYGVRAPDGVIVWFNSRAVELWGRTPALGDTEERFCGAHKLYHADGSFMAHADTPVALALNTGVSVHDEEVIIEKPDESRVTVAVHIDPIRDKDGTIIGALNFFQDITERKRAEEAIAERSSLLDLSNDAILVRDTSDRLMYWNNAAVELYGYTHEEAQGSVIHDLLKTKFPEPLESIVEKLQSENRWTGELIHTCKDGTQIVVTSRWALARDGHGNPKSVLETNNDITQQKHSERALRESEERFRTLADRLEQEVAIRTQELEERNSEILQQTEELRELSNRLTQTQDEERRRIARDLHDSAGQLISALGMNLANITQCLENKTEIVSAVKEGYEMVRQLDTEIRTISYLLHPPLLDETGLSHAINWYAKGLADRSGLKIQVEIADDFGRLADDLEVTIFRIVQESLTNIHRHSGSKTATIRLLRDLQNVSLAIQDNGTGIPGEKLASLRGHRSGVGITGMRERVRHLQGAMDIQSNANVTSGANGTKISVTLPLSRAAAPGKIVTGQKPRARAAK